MSSKIAWTDEEQAAYAAMEAEAYAAMEKEALASMMKEAEGQDREERRRFRRHPSWCECLDCYEGEKC